MQLPLIRTSSTSRARPRAIYCLGLPSRRRYLRQKHAHSILCEYTRVSAENCISERELSKGPNILKLTRMTTCTSKRTFGYLPRENLGRQRRYFAKPHGDIATSTPRGGVLGKCSATFPKFDQSGCCACCHAISDVLVQPMEMTACLQPRGGGLCDCIRL